MNYTEKKFQAQMHKTKIWEEKQFRYSKNKDFQKIWHMDKNLLYEKNVQESFDLLIFVTSSSRQV